ncbi:hypothetical protein BaRGS_00030221 [Batillaria attramentaria]|uniref:Uncharacterized protein n=1 Tax=Batillaria attramentaria TaxID=370345 RepID=A0ABD0JU18_9CAEN
MVVPILKRGGQTLLKQGVKTGVNILGDVLSGENIKTAAKRRAQESGRQLFTQAARALTGQSPPAPPGAPAAKKIKRGNRSQPRQSAARSRKTQRKRKLAGATDIFS